MTKNTYTNLLTHQNAINRVIDYIEGNICNNIELEHLAQVASLSKFHFLRVFKTLLGETPMQFLSRLRLEKIAAALISKPNSSISEICYEHGFTNMTIFAKNFKNTSGYQLPNGEKMKIAIWAK